jgi:uncharacterized protein YbjT (DUF2867 family)
MILVIVGRSKIGSALIQTLLDKSERVRALTRSADSARFQEGVEPVAGHLADIGSLAAAMSGVESVDGCSHPRRQRSPPHPTERSRSRLARRSRACRGG